MKCSLVGKSQKINIIRDSNAFNAYGNENSVEKFQCNYGLNQNYLNDLSDGNLVVVGYDVDQNARIIELKQHYYFMGTLFLPQLSSLQGVPHPLIVSFVKAAVTFRKTNGSNGRTIG